MLTVYYIGYQWHRAPGGRVLAAAARLVHFADDDGRRPWASIGELDRWHFDRDAAPVDFPALVKGAEPAIREIMQGAAQWVRERPVSAGWAAPWRLCLAQAWVHPRGELLAVQDALAAVNVPYIEALRAAGRALEKQ